MFSPFALEQLDRINEQLVNLRDIIREKDAPKMQEFLKRLRDNIH
jgi:hypothetical protein